MPPASCDQHRRHGRACKVRAVGAGLKLVFINVQIVVSMVTGLLIGGLVGCFVGVIEIFKQSPSDSLSDIKFSPDTLSIQGDVAITLYFIVQWIYMVVTVKQMIQRNPVIRNGPWFPITFGQVCAFLEAPRSSHHFLSAKMALKSAIFLASNLQYRTRVCT